MDENYKIIQFINSLEVYLTSVCEQLKDEDKEYLKGYAEAHKDIIDKLQRDKKIMEGKQDDK